MARRNRKIKRLSTAQVEVRLDATPERLSKGDHSEFVNPADIDDTEQPIGRTRRFFKLRHLDRLHRAGQFNQAQYMAGDWYRNMHERAQFNQMTTSCLGEHISGDKDYGHMARTEAAAHCRKLYLQAAEQWPQAMRQHMEKFLLQDTYPRLSHRARDRDLGQMRNALDRLAMYLRMC